MEFKDTNDVAVVPSNWLIGSNKCWWPGWKNSLRIEKAVKGMEDTDESFDTYGVKIMYETGMSYLKKSCV